MNNFFKPMLLMMAFALATFSFSNESFAADSPVEAFGCAIAGVTTSAGPCNGGNYTITVNVTMAANPDAGTIEVTLAAPNTGTMSQMIVSGQTMYTFTFNGQSATDGTYTANVDFTGPCGMDSDSATGDRPTAADCGGGNDCEDCVPNGTLAISNTNGNGSEICMPGDDTFEAQDITSDGTITGARTVSFTATNSITLNSGFQSNTSGTFTASIGTVSCTNLTDENGDVSRKLVVNNAQMPVSVNVTPNPFSSSATINYTLDTEGDVIIRVFNMKGEPVAVLANEMQVAGQHTVNFDAVNLPKGFYYLSLQTSTQQVTEQMVIMR